MTNTERELPALINRFSPLSGHTFFKCSSIADYTGKIDIGIMSVSFDNG